jgi:hypothetical protein
MPAEGIFIENVLFAEMPSSVNLAGRTATEIAGGVEAAWDRATSGDQ